VGRFWLVTTYAAVALACGAGVAPRKTPANHVAETPREKVVTHLQVVMFLGWDKCGVVHRVDVALDGNVVETVMASDPCPPPPVRQPNGTLVITTDSGGEPTTSKSIDVLPGRHTFTVTDRETGKTATWDDELPKYDTSADKSPMGILGVRIGDDKVQFLGMTHQYIIM
jgi:hypothetical protein